MHNRSVFPPLAAQFALACSLATLTYMITWNVGFSSVYYPQVLLVYAPLLFGVNRLFLRRERSFLSATLLNGALWAALSVSICVLEWSAGGSVLIIALLFSLCITVRGVCLATAGIDLRGLILTLDLTALLLVLFTCYLSASGKSYLWIIPIASGFAASVLGTITNRMGRSMGGREWLLVGSAFLVITLAVLLLVSVVAAPAGEGLVALWACLSAGINFLLKLMGRIIQALIALFPGKTDEVLLEPGVDMPELPEEEALQEINPIVMIVFALLLAVLLIALLIWVLRQLSRLRVGGRKTSLGTSCSDRKRPSLWQALRRLFTAWLRQLRILRFLHRHRDQPLGLYYILVRRCRMAPWHKRLGETPREFLNRLRSCSQEDRELDQALLDLIPLVDQALYAAAPFRSSAPQAVLIRQRVGRAVRTQFTWDLFLRIREKLNRFAKQANVPTA